ncbi:MAG: hypothetical protein ACJA2W_002763 [Planctomycetota bacterium]
MTVTKTVGSISVQWPTNHSDENIDWSYYERVEVGPSMEARLPHLPGATVKLLYWRVGAGLWLSPVDGLPVDPQPIWTFERDAPDASAGFVLEAKGDALRFHGATLFDRKTKVALSRSSSYGFTSKGSEELRIDHSCQVMHRADLLLELPLTYGQPEIKELELVDGETLTFGVHAKAQFVARGAGRIRSHGSTHGGLTGRVVNIKWDPSAGSSDAGWAAIAFSPQGLASKFQARVTGESTWRSLFGGNQVPLLQGVPPSAESVELRYLPHAARLQFSLPPAASLPAVKDLLQVNLGDVKFDAPHELQSALADYLQVDPSSAGKLDLEKLTYPLMLKNATPQDLMNLIRKRATPLAYVDTDQFIFRTTHDSVAQRFKSWVSALASRLGL